MATKKHSANHAKFIKCFKKKKKKGVEMKCTTQLLVLLGSLSTSLWYWHTHARTHARTHTHTHTHTQGQPKGEGCSDAEPLQWVQYTEGLDVEDWEGRGLLLVVRVRSLQRGGGGRRVIVRAGSVCPSFIHHRNCAARASAPWYRLPSRLLRRLRRQGYRHRRPITPR